MPSPSRPANAETVFTYAAPGLSFGRGAALEVGSALARLGATRVLLVTDPAVAATGWPDRLASVVRDAGLDAGVYPEVHVEPTDASLRAAVAYAKETGPWDAFLAVGGGSSIDTAKAVDLLTTNPGDLMDYVNQPVGGGQRPTRPLHPLVAVPTTTGTGSESTTICVLDVLDQHVKTGISDPALRPTLAVVDPDLTATQPAGVVACAGFDILCHALESWTAKPYTAYEHKTYDQRVPYCGANPISDVWAERALRLLAGSFRQVVAAAHRAADGSPAEDGDERARDDLALAATFAGLGFGNAGVHVPHANAYPIAGRVKGFRPEGYPQDEPMVPHGMAVALTAPAAFRTTFPASTGRHLGAALWLDPTVETRHGDADLLPRVLTTLMRDVGLPGGLSAVGYDRSDIPSLVDGALKQERLLATAPLPVGADDLATIFEDSLTLW